MVHRRTFGEGLQMKQTGRTSHAFLDHCGTVCAVTYHATTSHTGLVVTHLPGWCALVYALHLLLIGSGSRATATRS